MAAGEEPSSSASSPSHLSLDSEVTIESALRAIFEDGFDDSTLPFDEALLAEDLGLPQLSTEDTPATLAGKAERTAAERQPAELLSAPGTTGAVTDLLEASRLWMEQLCQNMLEALGAADMGRDWARYVAAVDDLPLDNAMLPKQVRQ